MNPFELLKNAGKLKEQANEMKAEIEKILVEGSSGGGIVKIKMNGKFEMTSVFIDPIAVDPRDVPMLQDLIRAAYTDASAKVKEVYKEKTEALAGPFGGLGNIFGGDLV